MPTPVTIRELADLAKCSVATVSFALRDSPRVALATRARIRELAEQRGYRANPLVAKLMAQKRAVRGPSVQAAEPTLRMVAEAAGCSPMAASLAIRGSPRVSAKSGERIREIAERIGYRANLAEIARAEHRRDKQVRLECSTVIAYVNLFEDLKVWRNVYAFRRIYTGLCERARQVGCSVEQFHLREVGMTGNRLSNILKTLGIQGVVIGGAPVPNARMRLDWASFSPVAQGFSVVAPKLSRVSSDCGQCLRLALREGRRLGYRRIGLYVWSEIDLRCRQEWSGAFLAYQMTLPPKERVPVCPMEKHGEKPFKAWVDRHRPDLILTFDGRVVEWLQELGMQVPGDVGVISLSVHPDQPRTETTMHGWAGIDARYEQIGAAAFDLVLAQMLANQRGLTEDPRTVLIEGHWVKGWTLQKKARTSPIRLNWKREMTSSANPEGE